MGLVGRLEIWGCNYGITKSGGEARRNLTLYLYIVIVQYVNVQVYYETAIHLLFVFVD